MRAGRKVGIVEIADSESSLQGLDDIALRNGIVLIAAFPDTIVIEESLHVVFHNFGSGGTHQAFQDRTDKTCTILAFLAVDEIDTRIIGHGRKTFCET